MSNNTWLDIAKELQFIAQTGLTYSTNEFDLERFQRIREISAEIVSAKTDLTLDKVKDLFCNETGFQTPKLDTRAAIIKDGKILLVKERIDGRWSLPGGWVDVNQSIKSNVIKEVKEEAGLDASVLKVVAIQDREKHNTPPSAYSICKIFVLCQAIGGQFQQNIETIESGYFSLDNLPELSVDKTTKEQIEMCFLASEDNNWEVILD